MKPKAEQGKPFASNNSYLFKNDVGSMRFDRGSPLFEIPPSLKRSYKPAELIKNLASLKDCASDSSEFSKKLGKALLLLNEKCPGESIPELERWLSRELTEAPYAGYDVKDLMSILKPRLIGIMMLKRTNCLLVVMDPMGIAKMKIKTEVMKGRGKDQAFEVLSKMIPSGYEMALIIDSKFEKRWDSCCFIRGLDIYTTPGYFKDHKIEKLTSFLLDIQQHLFPLMAKMFLKCTQFLINSLETDSGVPEEINRNVLDNKAIGLSPARKPTVIYKEPSRGTPSELSPLKSDKEELVPVQAKKNIRDEQNDGGVVQEEPVDKVSGVQIERKARLEGELESGNGILDPSIPCEPYVTEPGGNHVISSSLVEKNEDEGKLNKQAKEVDRTGNKGNVELKVELAPAKRKKNTRIKIFLPKGILKIQKPRHEIMQIKGVDKKPSDLPKLGKRVCFQNNESLCPELTECLTELRGDFEQTLDATVKTPSSYREKMSLFTFLRNKDNNTEKKYDYINDMTPVEIYDFLKHPDRDFGFIFYLMNINSRKRILRLFKNRSPELYHNFDQYFKHLKENFEKASSVHKKTEERFNTLLLASIMENLPTLFLRYKRKIASSQYDELNGKLDDKDDEISLCNCDEKIQILRNQKRSLEREREMINARKRYQYMYELYEFAKEHYTLECDIRGFARVCDRIRTYIGGNQSQAIFFSGNYRKFSDAEINKLHVTLKEPEDNLIRLAINRDLNKARKALVTAKKKEWKGRGGNA